MPLPRLEGCVPLLQVFDMRRSLAFYRGALGFETLQQAPAGDSPDWVLLGKDGVEVMLNTQFETGERPDHEDPARSTSHADTTLFVGCRELDAAFAALRAQGVDVDPPVVRAYGMRQLALRDPDGYGLCLQWRAERQDNDP